MASAKQVLYRLAWVGMVFCFLVIGSFPGRAATFTVNARDFGIIVGTVPVDVTDANPGDGVCETAPGNRACTLRAAIMEANALPGSPHTISLSGGTHTLTIPASGANDAATGDLNITKNVNIVGTSFSSLTFKADPIIQGPNIFDGIFTVAAGVTVNISGVTIRNGSRIADNSSGGAIVNFGTLTLTNSVITGNSARTSGGGIFNLGTLIIINSTVSNNAATDGNAVGGGIANLAGGTVTIANSTLSGNSALDAGGGIWNAGTLTLTNSTITGNSSGGNGGGIFNQNSADVFNSTITNNQADVHLLASGIGGGIFNDAGARFNFQNSILAGNLESGGVGECAGTITSNGNNLMQAKNCTVNGPAPVLADPKLGPLKYNGSLVKMHALLTGSPAIDGGNAGGCRDSLGALLTSDQRGFPRTVDGDHNGVPLCDLGAYEFDSGSLPRKLDFDGDGKSDIGFYRRADGAWAIVRSSDGGFNQGVWGGGAQDVPVPGDYDGDGKLDIAIYHSGGWSVKRSSDGGNTVVGWGGASQDVPVPGDYDGDRNTDIAIYRDGAWSILRSSDGGNTIAGWGGAPQDKTVAADYDGDGKTDIAIYRDGTWSILRSSDGGNTIVGWGGAPQDILVPADYDGDGKADVAIYRDGAWSILRSSDGIQFAIGWGGLPQDIPAPADYDGDGKADIAIYRNGKAIIRQSSNGVTKEVNWSGWAPGEMPLN